MQNQEDICHIATLLSHTGLRQSLRESFWFQYYETTYFSMFYLTYILWRKLSGEFLPSWDKSKRLSIRSFSGRWRKEKLIVGKNLPGVNNPNLPTPAILLEFLLYLVAGIGFAILDFKVRGFATLRLITLRIATLGSIKQ